MPIQISIFDLIREVHNSPQSRFEWDADNNLIYSGTCKNFNADGSEDYWEIKKYTYDANGNLILIKKQTGVWNDRASLGW